MQKPIVTDSFTLYNSQCKRLLGSLRRSVYNLGIVGTYTCVSRGASADVHINYGVRTAYEDKGVVFASIGAGKQFDHGAGRVAFLKSMMSLSRWNFRETMHDGRVAPFQVYFTCSNKRYTVDADPNAVMRYFITKARVGYGGDREKAERFDDERGGDRNLRKYLDEIGASYEEIG